MAVDTTEKRLSMLQFGSDVITAGEISPDGTIEQGDRQTLLWGYSGILWGEPRVATGEAVETISLLSDYTDIILMEDGTVLSISDDNTTMEFS